MIALFLAAAVAQVPPPLLAEERSHTVQFVWFAGQPGATAHGGLSPATVTVRPNPRRQVRVAVFEDVAGTAGAQWRSSVWMSSFLASSTVGRLLTDHEFGVGTSGAVDGPSAGALLTATMIAALAGVPVRPGVTMSGIVNPDGTIGPVGGLPQKIDAAGRAKLERFGYPVGQRYDRDLLTGDMVDVEAEARGRRMEVKELADVHDAYTLLTGEVLERPTPLEPSALELPTAAFEVLQAHTLDVADAAAAALARVKDLPPTHATLEEGQRMLERVRRQHDEGQAASASMEAFRTSVLADVVHRTMPTLTAARSGDLPGLAREVAAAAAVVPQVDATAKKLHASRPRTVPATVALLAGYDAVASACAFSRMGLDAVGRYDELVQAARRGKTPPGWDAELEALAPEVKDTFAALELAPRALEATTQFAAARAMLERARTVVTLHGEGGAPLTLELDVLEQLATTYISAAKANLDYFESLLAAPAPVAVSQASLARARKKRSEVDSDHAFAAALVACALEQRGKKGAGPSLYGLAAGVTAYHRSSQLVAKAYSLGLNTDGSGRPLVERQRALTSMLERAERKAREQAALAREVTGDVPVAARLAYLVARVDREGDAEDKIAALFGFWKSSALSQIATQLVRAMRPPAPPPPLE